MAWLGGSYSDLAGDLSNKKKSKSSSNLLNSEPDELDKGTVSRLKNATKLSENEIVDRHKEFNRLFPENQGVSIKSFRRLSCRVVDETEVIDFSNKIFGLFDADKDNNLSFEEFTLATEVHDTKGNPLGKLAWLFDNVYDKVSKVRVRSAVHWKYSQGIMGFTCNRKNL